jgi:hypothetical protein
LQVKMLETAYYQLELATRSERMVCLAP